MQTDRGREILKERFTVGFDQRREELLGLAVKETTLTHDPTTRGQRRRREDNTEDVDLLKFLRRGGRG
jgi:hypothetical protein